MTDLANKQTVVRERFAAVQFHAMKNALYAPSLALLILLGACGSPAPSQQQPADQANASNATSASNADSGWLTLRAQYMDCVQHRADDGVRGTSQTKTVVSSALGACEDQLNAMHDAFRSHLSAQMTPSGARKAADRVTHDTREKARTYLTGYVNYTRYQANAH